MQGKALVVNPAVIQPSAPPTIARRNGEKNLARFPMGPVIRLWKKVKRLRSRDAHGTHTGYTGYTGARITQTNLTTIQSSKTNDTPAPGRTTTRRPIQVGCGKRDRRRSWSVSQAGKPIRSYYTRSWCRSLINGRRAAYFPPERDYARSMATS